MYVRTYTNTHRRASEEEEEEEEVYAGLPGHGTAPGASTATAEPHPHRPAAGVLRVNIIMALLYPQCSPLLVFPGFW
jgi:hypothetical protein